METGSSRVTSKGQIVIPKKLREKYAIVPTMRIRWIPKEEGLLMVPEPGCHQNGQRNVARFGLTEDLSERKKPGKK